MGAYIIGSGIAGLVYGYFHPDYLVIGAEPGGAMANKIPLGPRYLHATQWTVKLLKELGLKAGPQEHIIAGYMEDVSKEVFEIETMNRTGRAQYLLKTRGVDSVHGDSVLEPSHTIFKEPTLSMITDALITALRQRKQLKVDKVEWLDLGGRQMKLERAGIVHLDKLVNTLPYPEFVKLDRYHGSKATPVGGTYLSIPVQFVFARLDRWRVEPFDYYYIPSQAVAYSRVSRVVGHDGSLYACFEYPGEEIADRQTQGVLLLPDYEALQVEASFTLKYGRIISREVYMPLVYQDYVRHFGRFAEWQDSYLTHHLVQKAQER